MIALAGPFGRRPLPVAVALTVAPAILALAVFVAVTHLPVRRHRPVGAAPTG